MIRGTFDRELKKLQDEILRLGSEVEEHLIEVVDILNQRDIRRAQQMIQSDEWVNELRIKIVMDALALIATQQPTAGDMRLIAAVLEIAGELERIHDYIKGIGKITIMIDEEPVIAPLTKTLPQIAEKARHMLRRALAAFTKHDTALAREIPHTDDEVDELYNRAYREIINYVTENPKAIVHAQRLEWAAHNLERSADRVINICEWIVYMTTGEFKELDTEIEAPPVS